MVVVVADDSQDAIAIVLQDAMAELVAIGASTMDSGTGLLVVDEKHLQTLAMAPAAPASAAPAPQPTVGSAQRERVPHGRVLAIDGRHPLNRKPASRKEVGGRRCRRAKGRTQMRSGEGEGAHGSAQRWRHTCRGLARRRRFAATTPRGGGTPARGKRRRL